MRFAKDRYTGNIVDAYEARRSAFSCPTCGGRVFLRAGKEREPHFAHFSGAGSPDCEEYHPWVFGGTNREPADHGVEDTPESLGLAVALNGVSWILLLRLPEVPTEELGCSSLTRLSSACVDVSCGGERVGTLPALDLRPGVGVARIEVPPALQEYRCQAAGHWPRGVTLERWAAVATGLSATGTLFRLRTGEWTRLREQSLVEWGESLLLVADERCPPPYQVTSEMADGIAKGGMQWRLWRLMLPETPHVAVAAWLERLGHEPKQPTWHVQFLSVPISFGDSGPQYEAGVPLVVELQAPTPGARASVSVTLGTNTHLIQVEAPASSTLQIGLSSNHPATGLLEVIDRGLSSVCFEFVAPDPPRAATDSPRLRARIGSDEWLPWQASSRRADRQGEVVFDVGVGGARLNLMVWLRGGQRRILTRVSPVDAASAAADWLSDAEVIEVDAGNLGHVAIPVGAVAGAERRAPANRRLTVWLNSLMAAATVCAGVESVVRVRVRSDHRRGVDRVQSWLSSLARVNERKRW